MATDEDSVEYRDIPGHPGYRVGDDGTIWSCRHRVGIPGQHGGTQVVLREPWFLLKPAYGKDHFFVRLADRKNYYVQRLVLLAFVGPSPGMEACHFPDRDPANNRLENLRWDTHKANQRDRVAHGTTQRGEQSVCAKLGQKQVEEIRKRYAQGGSTQKDLGAEYGVSAAAIWRITNWKNWKHLRP